MDEPLDAVLKIWKSVETPPPFEKISIEEVLFLYEKAYKDRKEIDGFEDKHMLYRMLTCSLDIKNRDIVTCGSTTAKPIRRTCPCISRP